MRGGGDVSVINECGVILLQSKRSAITQNGLFNNIPNHELRLDFISTHKAVYSISANLLHTGNPAC